MKIILKSDVRDLGRAGELVEVKEGYARNFLLPRSLAVPATVGNLKDFQKRIATAKAREDRERNSAQEVADRLQGKKVVIIHRAVEGSTRIHGSVTAIEIAQALTVLAGKEIERRDVDIRQPIRSLGEYRVNLKLVRGLTVPIQVLVTDREPGEETEAEATEQVEEVAAA